MTSQKSNSRPRWLAALLMVLTLAVYANNLHGAFVLDDVPWILDNQNIRTLWPLWKPLLNTSRPVVQWSLAVNYACGGLNLVGYHLVNNLIHALTALVLFGVVRRTLRTSRLVAKFGDAADGLGFAVALLWALHPLNTESVTYIIQRSESLAGLFSIFTLYCVIRGATADKATRWNTLAVLSCALAVGSKPVSALVPFAVFAYDWLYLDDWHKRWRLYVGLAGTWVVLIVALLAGQKEWMGSAGVVSGARAVPWLDYARLQPGVILHYLRQSIWPDGFCLLYGRPQQPSEFLFLMQCAVIAIVLAITIWLLCRKNAAGFLGLWFFLMLAPTSSVIPLLHPIFEHRMYLPLMVVITAIVIGTHTILFRQLRLVALALAAVALGTLTWQRNLDYRTEVSIWRDTARKAPANPDAHYALGLALATAEQPDDAGAEFAETLRLNPEFSQVQYDWGLTLLKAGRDDEARTHFREALLINPDYAEAHDGIGVILYHQGKLREAIEQFFEATRLKPDDVEARRNLALALREQQQRSGNQN